MMSGCAKAIDRFYDSQSKPLYADPLQDLVASRISYLKRRKVKEGGERECVADQQLDSFSQVLPALSNSINLALLPF